MSLNTASLKGRSSPSRISLTPISPCPEEKKDDSDSSFDIIGLEQKLPTKGVVAYDSEQLQELGVKKGDTVGFKENRDYRFKINGEECYRTRCEDLLYVA